MRIVFTLRYYICSTFIYLQEEKHKYIKKKNWKWNWERSIKKKKKEHHGNNEVYNFTKSWKPFLVLLQKEKCIYNYIWKMALQIKIVGKLKQSLEPEFCSYHLKYSRSLLWKLCLEESIANIYHSLFFFSYFFQGEQLICPDNLFIANS